MAASAANLTSTNDPGGADDESSRPSIFELVSQQSFAHILKPAIFHIIKTLAERYPEGKFPLVFRKFDEVYLSFDSLVQWHYIVTRGATLSEAFYGLERQLVSTSNDNRLLRIRLAYLIAVISPYLRSKLEKAYENRDGNNTEVVWHFRDMNPTLQKLVSYYPYFKGIMHSVNLVYILAYAFGYTESHDLVFQILGMKLGYISPERSKLVEGKTSEIFRWASWKNPKNFPILLLRSLGESVLFAVEMGSFCAQFLDWWYNDPGKERVTLASLPVPPPPTSRNSNCVEISDQEKNKCPLCRRAFRNPTALSVSGIVFCYGCISSYLKQEGKCPLTSLRCSADNLIRIYM